MNAEERFWQKVDKSGECWEWLGAKVSNGYGSFRHDGRHTYAHRYAAKLAGMGVEVGLVDHTCHHRSCVNPAHLRVVTSKQNSENLSGAHRDNPIGIRGVSWDKRARSWQAGVCSNGRSYRKRFKQLSDAESWVRQKRLELFTHSDMDRLEPERMSIVRGI